MSRSLALAGRHRERGVELTPVWDLELPARFGAAPEVEHRAARESAGLVDASYRGILDFSGENAETLLERIVSIHVAALGDRSGKPACLLSAKGRIVALFDLFRLPDGAFRAVFAEPLRDAVTGAFTKYALLDDVAVADRCEELAVLALIGPSRARVLEGEGIRVPAAPLERAAAEVAGVPVEIVCGRRAELDLWVPREALETAWDHLHERTAATGGRPVGWTALEALRIEAGAPLYGHDYDETSFPAEVLEDGRLVYDKCYVGQEIVARMRTYGHANRRLFQVACDAERDIRRGERLLAAGADAGCVTSACRSFRFGVPLGLALIKRSFWEVEALELEDGGRAELRSLPAASPGD